MQEEEVKEGKFYGKVIIGGILIVILIAFYLSTVAEPPYSLLYFEKGSYENYLAANNVTSFRFGVENREGVSQSYSLSIAIGDRMIKRESLTLANNEVFERNESLKVTEELPVPISVKLSTKEKDYKVIYWIKGRI